MGQGETGKFNSIREYESTLAMLVASYKAAEYHRQGTSAVDDYPLYVISIGNPELPVIMFEAEIHGRHEWKATHLLLNYLRRLPQLNPGLLEHYSIIAVPMVNPYGYFHTTYHNGHVYSNGWDRPFYGVNLNRQFPYHWQYCQVSQDYWTNPIYAEYRTPDFYSGKGPKPFSEPETCLLHDLVLKYHPVAYIALHVMDINPEFNNMTKNYNIQIWYGKSQQHDLMAMLREKVLPVLDARHDETSMLGQVSGGALPETCLELCQSYLWTQEVMGIPSFVIEAGQDYSDDYLTDLYSTVLQHGVNSFIGQH